MCGISWPTGHACGQCGAPAIVSWGYPGSSLDFYACDRHDPWTGGGYMTAGFRYVRVSAATPGTCVVPLGTSVIAPAPA